MGKIRQKNNQTKMLLLLIIKSRLLRVRIARIFVLVGHQWPHTVILIVDGEGEVEGQGDEQLGGRGTGR